MDINIGKQTYKKQNRRERLGIGGILFFSLYLILPDYFALEIIESLPLLTVSRLILFGIMFYWLFKSNGKISLRLCINKRINQTVIIYIVGMVLINVINISQTMRSVKEIFSLIFEQFFLVWIISKMITTKEKLLLALRMLVYSSGVVAVISSIGSLIGYNPFYLLSTAKRQMLQAGFVRMGMLRAEAGFGHAVYYGMYCVIMIVIAAYLYEQDRGRKFITICCIGLNVIGLLFSNSRGSFVILAVVICLIIFNKNLNIVRNYVKIIFLVLIGVMFLCLILEPARNFILNIIMSCLAILNKNIVVENYGNNESGMLSRFAQLSSLLDVAKNKFLFGYGVGVQNRASTGYGVQWLWRGEWSLLETFDMGIVSTVCQFGYAGEILKILLFCCLIRQSWIKRRNSTYRLFFLLILTYLLGLLTISGLTNVLWVIIGLYMSYVNIYLKGQT